MVTLPTFRCEQLHARLTRAACAAQHRHAKRGLQVARTGSAGVYGSPCVRCAIGKAHAAGLEPLVNMDPTPVPERAPAPERPVAAPRRPRAGDETKRARVEAAKILRALDERIGPRRRYPTEPVHCTGCGVLVTKRYGGSPKCHPCRITLEHGGERLSLTEWSRRAGAAPSTIRSRVRSGWSVADAVTMPADQGRKHRRRANHGA